MMGLTAVVWIVRLDGWLTLGKRAEGKLEGIRDFSLLCCKRGSVFCQRAVGYKPAALVVMRNESMRIASGDKRLLALIHELSDVGLDEGKVVGQHGANEISELILESFGEEWFSDGKGFVDVAFSLVLEGDWRDLF